MAAKRMTKRMAFEALHRQFRRIGQMDAAARALEWDRLVMMPPGSSEHSELMLSAVEEALAGMRESPDIDGLIAECSPPNAACRRMVDLFVAGRERKARVPERVRKRVWAAKDRTRRAWTRAKAEDDFSAILPDLRELVAASREKGAALGGDEPYDGLLEGYERGMTGAMASDILSSMRPPLVALRERLLALPPAPRLEGSFPEAEQLSLLAEIAENFGYSLDRGRIDPLGRAFMSGVAGDVRIAVRMDESNPLACLYSGMHEIGHAVYEQGIDPEYAFTPLGEYASVGLHESQSRIFENQIGRSREFCGWLFGEMRARFGEIGVGSEEEFHRAANLMDAQRGFLRVGSDEIQYNLHVMLRFDLERELVNGGIEADDLEDAWNGRFESDFGFPVDRAGNGVLADVHWFEGSFGYFPTYALGNVYAGCLHAAMQRDVPGLGAALARGSALPAADWLADRVQRHGSLHDAPKLVSRACGAKPSPKPLLAYLEAKVASLE